MRTVTLFTFLAFAAVAASAERSLLSRLFFSWPISKPSPVPAPAAPVATTAATTKAPETTTTMTTTAPPKGELPEDAVSNVLAMFSMYPQLQGHEEEVFNSSPQGNDPMSQILGDSDPKLKNAVNCLQLLISSHPQGTPWDMNTQVTCTI